MQLERSVVPPAALAFMLHRAAKLGRDGGADCGGIDTRPEADRCFVNVRLDSHHQRPVLPRYWSSSVLGTSSGTSPHAMTSGRFDGSPITMW